MNPEIKELWISALRSGDYKQGRGVLKNTVNGVDKYCCLGVLCELAVKAQIVNAEPSLANSKVTLFGSESGYPSEVLLPFEVSSWAGLDSTSGRMYPPEPYGLAGSSLTTLNDEARLTFEEIADVIERRF